MIRDITIGQYFRTNSLLHRMDPRVKIVGTLVYAVSLFFIKDYISFAVAAVCFCFIVRLSRVPFRFIIKGLKPVFVMLLFTAVLQLLCTSGDDLVHFGIVHITIQGVHQSVFMLFRLTLLIMGSSMMTLTTTPNQLTDGIEKLLRPLNHIRVPVGDLAMTMSIALRFIPILIEELDKIMKAQLARGADLESGNLIQRLKNMVPLLVPLFSSAIRRANELAYAMDARCYHGGKGRTKMKPLQYTQRDYVTYMVIFLYVAGLVIVAYGKAWIVS
ncbi:MAG: energy-coupling factor transporter transmembrane protein EcfT [Lachnospiraceae bacterium]|nr:energy-coupling factor transporter transmembrane protein EcfT [Lachnospiraceae bacterium]